MTTVWPVIDSESGQVSWTTTPPRRHDLTPEMIEAWEQLWRDDQPETPPDEEAGL